MDLLSALYIQREKNIEFQQNNLLKEAYAVLNKESTTRKASYINYFSNESGSLLTSNPLVLDRKKVFSIQDIKNICIDYRLRFLDRKFYVAELPYDAHIKSTAFEIEAGQPLVFKIVTESVNFKSTYPNTQHLLFADIGNGDFYYICSWGNEYSNYRKYISMPFTRIEMLFAVIFAASSFLTIITPTHFITTKANIDYFSMIRMAFFFWCVVALSAMFAYYIVAIRKGMNSSEWDNPSFM